MFVKPTTAFMRTDFGIEWYARCANESPSIASSVLISERFLERQNPLHQSVGCLVRGGCDVLPAQVVDVDRRAVRDPQVAEARQTVCAFHRGGNERRSGLEGDARGTAARPSLELLHEPLRPTRPLGEHRHDFAGPYELDRGLDRLGVLLAAPHGKRAGAVQHVRQGPPVELRFRHETQLPVRVEGHAERPRIEARDMVAGEDISALRRKLFDPLRVQAKEPVEHRTAENCNKAVHGARTQQRYLDQPWQVTAKGSASSSSSPRRRRRRLRAISATASSSSPAWVTSATCPSALPTFRPNTRRRSGRGSA